MKDTSKLVDNNFKIKQSEKQLKLIEANQTYRAATADEQMEAFIQEDEQVQNHFRLISSVVGIGRPPPLGLYSSKILRSCLS
ncbi:MAG: hypothetical protein AAF632_26590 [Bacteroidota bacterium]